MPKNLLAKLFLLLAFTVASSSSTLADEPFTRKADVLYGRKDGMALTMDVFTPKNANAAAVVQAVSGGYFSAHQMINPIFFRPLLDRGYTVFAVGHGSQPRYTVPEIVNDLNRSVRFIRHHAKDYGIDPNRIGIVGGSSGGNLSLMVATAGDAGNPSAPDPVDRESSRVQAVACFFPPTDWLNWGAPGEERIHAIKFDKPFRAAFDYRELDAEKRMLERVTDEAKLREIAISIAPIHFVSKDDPPTLVIHGADDKLVPFQQAETFVARLKEAGVEAKLVEKPGAGHGWPDMLKDVEQFADWFDKHLK